MTNNEQPVQKPQPMTPIVLYIPNCDLSQLSDRALLSHIGDAYPELLKFIGEEVIAGSSDQEIMRPVYEAGASPIAMRNTQRVIRAVNVLVDAYYLAHGLRRTQKSPATAP